MREQLRYQHIFGQKIVRAIAGRGFTERVFFHNRQENYRGGGHLGLDTPRSLQASHTGQRNIDKNDVGLQLPGQWQELVSAEDFADNFKVRFGVETPTYELSELTALVSNQNFDRTRSLGTMDQNPIWRQRFVALEEQ